MGDSQRQKSQRVECCGGFFYIYNFMVLNIYVNIRVCVYLYL